MEEGVAEHRRANAQAGRDAGPKKRAHRASQLFFAVGANRLLVDLGFESEPVSNDGRLRDWRTLFGLHGRHVTSSRLAGWKQGGCSFGPKLQPPLTELGR